MTETTDRAEETNAQIEEHLQHVKDWLIRSEALAESIRKHLEEVRHGKRTNGA
jgi:hypothetical protein